MKACSRRMLGLIGCLGSWDNARKEFATLKAVADIVRDDVEQLTPASIDARLGEQVKADIVRQTANREWLDETIGVGGADRAKAMLPSILHADFDREGACTRAALRGPARGGFCRGGAVRERRDSLFGGRRVRHQGPVDHVRRREANVNGARRLALRMPHHQGAALGTERDA